MATFISHSPEDTCALGEDWGRAAKAGWVIGLSGDLGAGKTQLVKGLARGLGISSRIQSATFALVREYDKGRLPLAHLDLYRLDTAEQIIGAGLEDYLRQPAGVVVVEWCERWPGFGILPVAGTEFIAPDASIGRRKLPFLRLARIRQLNETSRSIWYEDLGA